MNWDAIGAVSEGLGAIAVLLTLGYLSVQIRQNSHIQKTQAHAHMTSERQVQVRAILENEPLRTAVRKVINSQELTEDEEYLLYFNTVSAIRHFESELYQHSMGMIEDEELELQRNVLLLPQMRLKAVAAGSLHTYSESTQKEILKLIDITAT